MRRRDPQFGRLRLRALRRFKHLLCWTCGVRAKSGLRDEQGNTLCRSCWAAAREDRAEQAAQERDS